jgi:hypothetical protein
MKKGECAQAAYSFITLYDYVDAITDKMRIANLYGVPIAQINEMLDSISNQFDNLFQQGHLTDIEHTELRTSLQDVRGHLPAIDYLPSHQSDRIAQPMKDTEKLKWKLVDTMFQSVAECEYKGK